MSDRDGDPDSRPSSDEESPTPFDRFQDLARRLLHVSRNDVREAEAREAEKRRTA